MGIYRILWLSVAAALGAVGAAVASLYLPWGTLIALAVIAAILGPLVATGVHTQTHEEAAVPLPYVLRATGVAVVGTVAVSGLVALFGAIALLGLGLLAVMSPAVLRRLLARAPHASGQEIAAQPHTVAPPGPAPAPPLACQTLSDAELCWRWRTSFAALQRAASTDERIRLIETRCALLDELADRDPAGFMRWLDSGARAASDPTRFFSSTHSGHPARRPRHDTDR